MAVAEIAVQRGRQFGRDSLNFSKQIARSIERFGFTNPLLVSKDREVIAGHGRLRAAQLLGLTSVPIVILATMSEGDRRAYVLADNKLAEKNGITAHR